MRVDDGMIIWRSVSVLSAVIDTDLDTTRPSRLIDISASPCESGVMAKSAWLSPRPTSTESLTSTRSSGARIWASAGSSPAVYVTSPV